MKLKYVTRLNMSFTAKVNTYMIGALLFVTCIFTYFFMNFQLDTLESEIIRDGRILARISADNVRLGIFANDKKRISESLKTAINLESVIGVCAYGMNGELILRESGLTGMYQVFCLEGKPMPPDIVERLKKSTEVVYYETTHTIDFWSTVYANPQEFTEETLYFQGEDNTDPEQLRIIGFVGLIFDKEPSRKSIREIVARNIIILLVFLVMGIIASYYIVRGITEPFNKLVSVVKSQGVMVADHDEMHQLADSFSGMVGKLSSSVETISDLKQGLERQVEALKTEVARRRKIEGELRESEDKFRSISEGIADGVAILLDDSVAWNNKAFCDILGYGKEDLLDRKIKTILPEFDNLQKMTPQKHDDGPFRSLIKTKRTDNQDIVVEAHAQKIIFGKKDGVQVIIRDITELDEAEKQRQELEVKSLGQSKLASLGKIAANVAHEINQPLSFIKVVYESILGDLRDEAFDVEEVEENCLESLRQVDRITAITDHLRSFGRMDNTLNNEVRISEVLVNSLTLMGGSLRLDDIELIPDFKEIPFIDKDMPAVKGNGVQLEQVFINLFQNSVDAMKGCEKKKISITLREQDEVIEICFADTGPGVEPGVVESMFEPFFTTKAGKDDRTGLGLAIVNNIIKEHNGTIEYRAIEGWGARFVITLPKCA